MHINWFFFSSLLLSITTLFLIVIFLKYSKEESHYRWLLSLISLFIWSCGATLSALFKHEILSNIFYRIACIGAALSSALILHTFSAIVKSKNIIILALCYFLSLSFSILIIATNLIFKNQINKFYDNFWVPIPGNFFYVWFLSWLLIIMYANSIFFYFFSIRKDTDRLVLKFFAIPILLGCISAILNFMLPYSIWIAQFGNMGISICTLTLTYAIFRHQVLGIEVVYKKGLLYSILIAVLTSIYLLLIIVIESLFRGIIGYKSFILSLSSAFLIALLFNPLRNKIQLLVDKIFLGKSPQEIAQENIFLKQELERSERLKTASILSLGLAHEIKNPLTTLKTFSEYLLERKNDEAFLAKFARIIPAEVERINNIVHRLLDFSKPNPPTFKISNICDVMRETLDLLSNDFLKRKIKIIENCEDHGLMVNIDTTQIKQVILNILLNSMDAMPKGGNIYISAKSTDNNKIEICIEDEGAGISKENLKNIFNPFFTTKDEGTGLGLGICHNIIKNHNGTIEIESEENKGTTVKIKLPLAL